MNDLSSIALLLYAFIGLVLLFAQLKLFSIDATLKEIQRDLREKDHQQ